MKYRTIFVCFVRRRAEGVLRALIIWTVNSKGVARTAQMSQMILLDLLLWYNSLRFDIYRNLEEGSMKLYGVILKCDHFIDKVSVL